MQNNTLHAAVYFRSYDCKHPEKMVQKQTVLFENHAQHNNMKIIHIYWDPEISGTKNRVAFNPMMRDAENGLFDVILMKNTDFLCLMRLTIWKIKKRLRQLILKFAS
jgi:DNA invertase Pin-like site-specific DNA recombinase